MVIAGDGPERPELEAQAAELDLGQHVRFTGWIEPQAVFDFMNTATMVLMPSSPEKEGLPNVAIQAALMARPVIGTRVTGLEEVIVPGETGILVEPESSAALAEEIAFLLEHPQAAAHMGQAARRRAADIFSWSQFLESYVALYEQCGRHS